MSSLDLTDEEILEDPVGLAERGENPTVLGRLPSGWAVFGMTQLLPGYCVLLAAPEVKQLNDLDHAARAQFLTDMAVVGDAIQAECGPLRINYSILGNDLALLHAHVHPRYESEPAPFRRRPPFSYGADAFGEPQHSWRRPEHQARLERLRLRLQDLSTPSGDPIARSRKP